MSLRIIVRCLCCLHDQKIQSSIKNKTILCRSQVFVITFVSCFHLKATRKMSLACFQLVLTIFLPLNVLGPVSNISSKSVLFTVDFAKTEEIDLSLKCIIYPLSNARNAPFELSGASSWLSLSFSHFYSFPSPVSLCQRGWCCQAAKTLWYPFCMLVRKKHSYEYSGHSAISRRGKKDGR